ncbi:cupin domain-containing protein [Undibacterium fentianense]|uniref:Cupin domain-containing protein n=1 Tax=Undibacterium fentianense TaxID=2828728 RepID=A0A941E176_9BURK|nr:cupin domain-containing protein [Undibacterium fentianense]MBR7801354.1 cupin domain-containing protein [Undibacterium fentianense]
MLKLHFSTFTLEDFLQNYWQQRPVVIRLGFPEFADLICPNDLAGLACEDNVESRLIYKKDGEWQAEAGPFESYEHVDNLAWTLIVQAVNHWSPEVARLVEVFSFIPKWRFDDVMISYSTPGAGVGPHIDLYDVFICQGSGRRTWRVGEQGTHRQFAAHPALLHTDPFIPIIDVELLPGDILYIPPGFPHDGVSLETSMSFSVGFRSKSARDMLSGLADYLIDQDLGNTLISDAGRQIHRHQGLINSQDFNLIQNQMRAVLEDKTLITKFIGSFLTRTKCLLDLQELDDPYTEVDLLAQLQLQDLKRTGGLRCFYFEDQVEQRICYVNGECYQFEAFDSNAISLICDQERLTWSDLKDQLIPSDGQSDCADLLTTLTEWVNLGYWYFEDQE